MKQKTKKKIAREIVILFCCVIITGFAWIFIIVKNYYFNHKVIIIENKISDTDKKNDSLVIVQNKYLNINSTTVTKKALLDYYATIKAKPYLTTQEIYSKFPEFNNDNENLQLAINYVAITDSLDKVKSSKTKLLSELAVLNNKVFTNKVTTDFLMQFFLIAISIVYPVRFLILLLIWAIKTIKEPSNK